MERDRIDRGRIKKGKKETVQVPEKVEERENVSPFERLAHGAAWGF